MTKEPMKGCTTLPSIIVLFNSPFRSPGFPLGLFSDYSNHGAEFFIHIREKRQNRMEITSNDQLYMTVVGRGDKKCLYDNQGALILNICNKTLNFGGEYQVGYALR